METNPTQSKTILILTLTLIILVALLHFTLFITTSDKIESAFEGERSGNVALSLSLDNRAWHSATNYPLIQNLTEFLAIKIADGRPVVEGKEGAVERIWDKSPENLMIMGLFIDYRLYAIYYISPIFIVLALPILIDALMHRRKLLYQNSFTSPLKHNLGGQAIAVPSTYLVFFLLFVPASIPSVYLFFIFLFKLFGWWLWITNLPKRI